MVFADDRRCDAVAWCWAGHCTVEVLFLKDGTFTEPIVLGKMMNDSHSQQRVCVRAYIYIALCVTCKEEAAED